MKLQSLPQIPANKLHLIKVLPDNRGLEGKLYLESKIKELEEKFAKGIYHTDLIVHLNKYLFCIEGNHRLEFAKRNNLPVSYILTTSKKSQSTNKVALHEVAQDLNSSKTRWSPTQSFNSAIKDRKPLALFLQAEIDKLNSEITNEVSKKNSVKATWVYGLMTQNFKLFKSGDPLPDLYFIDNKAMKHSKTEEYKTDRQHYVDISKLLYKKGVQSFNGLVAGWILKRHWLESKLSFDIVEFKKKLAKATFKDCGRDIGKLAIEIERIWKS